MTSTGADRNSSGGDACPLSRLVALLSEARIEDILSSAAHDSLIVTFANPHGLYVHDADPAYLDRLSNFDHVLCDGGLHEASAPALVKTERTCGVAFE